MSIGPVVRTSRVRPEWKAIDLETGTCTTHICLYPDEVDRFEIWLLMHPYVPATVIRITPHTATRRPYWSHYLISWSSANTSAAMSNGHNRPALEAPDTDPRVRSKSIPSRLRGDATDYVPRRANSLEDPLTSASPTSQALSRVNTSMPMTTDVTTTNPVVNRSVESPLSHPLPVHVSSLMDNSAVGVPPKSPKTKFTPTFPPVDENAPLNLKTETYRQLLLAPQFSVPATYTRLPNPFITIKRKYGSVDVSLKYGPVPQCPDANSQSNNSKNGAKKQQVTGPYRYAALWDMVGLTFCKPERDKKVKPKKVRVLRESLERTIPPSSLLNQIFPDDDEYKNMFDDTEVRAEWTNFVNSTENKLGRSQSRHVSRLPITPTRVSTHERDLSNFQLEDRRGRARTRPDLLDRYSMERMPRASRFSSPVMSYRLDRKSVV